MSDPEAELLLIEQVDFWTMYRGFADAGEMKQWGEQMERERLAYLATKKVITNEKS